MTAASVPEPYTRTGGAACQRGPRQKRTGTPDSRGIYKRA
jgi:hypothetical protein